MLFVRILMNSLSRVHCSLLANDYKFSLMLIIAKRSHRKMDVYTYSFDSGSAPDSVLDTETFDSLYTFLTGDRLKFLLHT